MVSASFFFNELKNTYFIISLNRGVSDPKHRSGKPSVILNHVLIGTIEDQLGELVFFLYIA